VRFVASALALFPITAMLGIHKFYVGSWGWGCVFLACLFFSSGVLSPLLYLVSFIQGVLWFTWNKDQFDAKYNKQHGGFTW
jgi:TM2 domain-containing membrane protein YozV